MGGAGSQVRYDRPAPTPPKDTETLGIVQALVHHMCLYHFDQFIRFRHWLDDNFDQFGRKE